jgi:hypothetical protein
VKRVVVIVLRFGDTNQRCSTLLPITDKWRLLWLIAGSAVQIDYVLYSIQL